jgi:hypothetical protein
MTPLVVLWKTWSSTRSVGSFSRLATSALPGRGRVLMAGDGSLHVGAIHLISGWPLNAVTAEWVLARGCRCSAVCHLRADRCGSVVTTRMCSRLWSAGCVLPGRPLRQVRVGPPVLFESSFQVSKPPQTQRLHTESHPLRAAHLEEFRVEGELNARVVQPGWGLLRRAGPLTRPVTWVGRRPSRNRP